MGGFRPPGGIPNPVPTPAPPPSQFPGIVFDIPLRLSKSSRPASRGRDHEFEGGLGESPRSGSRLLQPPLPGGKGVMRLETRDRPLEMSSCVRESTARLYQSQWLSFCGWCRGIDATIPLIVDFLIHLRRDKGFSLSALKGYRSAINSVMALKGTDLAESRELTMLF